MTPDEIMSILLSPFNKFNLCGAVFLRFMRANFTGYFILMDAFSVSSAWESTRASHPSVYWWKYVWNKWVHPKIAGFVWRLMHKAISTDERIKSLGFRFPSCCLCCSSLIVNPSRISLFKESWLHPFGPSSRLILTSQYPKLSLSSSVLSLGGLILFAPSILFYAILLLYLSYGKFGKTAIPLFMTM